MWYNSLSDDQSWSTLWSKYVRCKCGSICKLDGQCSVCEKESRSVNSSIYRDSEGNKNKVQQFMMGGEGRYEDWLYLDMLEREWFRPITEKDNVHLISEQNAPSPKAMIVLVFWTYFETRIERIYRETIKSVPETILEDLLHRYSSIGYRLDKLYKISFSTTYLADLSDLGYSNISDLLQRIQTSRNDFVHGHPEAIDDRLVEELVENLKVEHESYISVFNKRIKTDYVNF